ncbi:MAG: hypothetical protein M3381_15000 [Actinomycetota bacterium]|nr:hypothetical protein [Actinomycetota bacterium]
MLERGGEFDAAAAAYQLALDSDDIRHSLAAETHLEGLAKLGQQPAGDSARDF